MTWRQLSQLLAFVSKFPTLLYYKMKGITPLVFKMKNWTFQFFANLRIVYEVANLKEYVI